VGRFQLTRAKYSVDAWRCQNVDHGARPRLSQTGLLISDRALVGSQESVAEPGAMVVLVGGLVGWVPGRVGEEANAERPVGEAMPASLS